MRLEVLLHFITVILILFMLLWTTMLSDLVGNQSYLKALLLNLGFLIPSDNTPYTLGIICHLLIGSVIYFVFMLLFHTPKRLCYLRYIPLSFLFITLCPFLVPIAQRLVFQFGVAGLVDWTITHILFISLMALVMPRIKQYF